MVPRDRLGALLSGPANTPPKLNGIDFVEVLGNQLDLKVHFLTKASVTVTAAEVTIDGGDTIPTVPVVSVDGTTSDPQNRPLLLVHVAGPGDFSTYTLTVASANLDPFFAQSRFSFKAACPSNLDCAAPGDVCPPETRELPPIDYLAKDFRSFRKALLDFSATRYPEWMERSEADFGMMFLEALSGLADDLSYTQDRIAAEAALDTATQRRSIVRLSRLVDYEPRPATSARVLLQCNVSSAGPIQAGLLVSAQGADGLPVEFETGRGLGDATLYPADPLFNGARAGAGGIQPYVWDDSQLCLKAGAVEMWVLGWGFKFSAGQQLLIDTAGESIADPPVRQVVILAESAFGAQDSAVEELDHLFPTGGLPTQVTHIRWRSEDALGADHDLTRTTLAGNLVPATQGWRFTESFAIRQGPPPPAQMMLAVERTGANSSLDEPVPQFLHTLAASGGTGGLTVGGTERLAWLGSATDPGASPLPEIALAQPPAGMAPRVDWVWRRRLLDAEPFERAFTVDPVAFRPVAQLPDGSAFWDYDGDDGDTIRFGDGVFGEIPPDGAVFRVTYRCGVGPAGNVPASSITTVDPSALAKIPGLSVTNPFAASGGEYEEADESVRRLAPQAFRALQFRAVTRTDYEQAAETLPWVQRAGTSYRWTGSWLTVFTAADPKRAVATSGMGLDQHAELIGLLNRYRLAGYESYVPAPAFASLDVVVTVCARADAFRQDVETAVVAVLGTGVGPGGKGGFFHPNNFTFGIPLERSALEAAVAGAYGVAGVLSVQVRRRGTTWMQELYGTLAVSPDQIIRADSDPDRPDAGSVRVRVEGGK
jgi:hypothetical protein